MKGNGEEKQELQAQIDHVQQQAVLERTHYVQETVIDEDYQRRLKERERLLLEQERLLQEKLRALEQQSTTYAWHARRQLG